MKSSDEFLDQILREAPSSETLYLLLKRQKAEGRIDTVIRECIDALGRYPRDVRIRALLAEACFECGWLSRAEAEVERATAQIEDVVSLYKLQAQIYSKMNKPEEAARSLKIYLAHRPDEQESLVPSQEVTPAPEPPSPSPQDVESRSETLQEKAAYSAPEIATPTLAEVYFAQGQIQEAISTYEKIVARHPEAEQSRLRLKELKAMIAPAPAMDRVDPGVERSLKKKEKLIQVLESWKEAITQPSSER
jgi:tetratricopeptide (TPR) repeat protein